MLYDRKIKYLDYMENGIKVGGGGFAKLELRNGKFRLHLQVSGLHGTDSFLRDVILLTDTGESGLGQMELKEGAGSFRYEGSLEKGIGQTDARYEELQGIKIPISNTREIRCIWGKEPGRAERDQTGQDRHREKAGTDQRTGTEAGARRSWCLRGSRQYKAHRIRGVCLPGRKNGSQILIERQIPGRQ